MTNSNGHIARGVVAYELKSRGGNEPVCKDNMLHLQGKRNPGPVRMGVKHEAAARRGTEYSAWVRGRLGLR